MLTRLQCNNFRGFRSLDIELAAITALLGPNSSGKSTVLHAVRLACDLLRLALESESTAGRDDDGDWIRVADGLLIDGKTLLPLADWQALFTDQQVGTGVSFSVHMWFAAPPIEELRVQVDCARNQQLKLNIGVRSSGALKEIEGLNKKSKLVNERLTRYLQQHAPIAVFIPPFYGTIVNEEMRAKVVIDRLLGSGDQSHVVRNLVASLETLQLEQLNSFLEEAIGATLVYRTNGDKLQSESPMRVTFRDSNGELELSAAGAGLVNLISLYAALSRWRRQASERPVLFLLDEPEAHLHPKLQASATALLGRTVTQEFKAQLILATHSVDILDRLSRDGHLLVRCDRRAEPSAVTLGGHGALFEDLAEWAELTPYTTINALASRRLLFVEGADERALLPRLAELHFRNRPGDLERFRSWAVVALGGASKASVAKLVAQLLESDALRARASSASFEVVVLLDRDYERAPGTQEMLTGAVRETQIVWSHHSLESLFLQPEVLTVWMRALLAADAPADLEVRIEDAVRAADADESLRREAAAKLGAARVAETLRSGSSLTADHNRPMVEALQEAQDLVAKAPAVWQRGKDRAAFILRRVREGLDGAARAHFPTSLTSLLQRADLGRVDWARAVPREVSEVLRRLV